MLWWDEKLAIGISSIDRQHKSIFDKAEEILSLDQKTSKDDVMAIFSFLVKYSVNHFAEEEDLMINTNYPNFPKHREEHTYFMNELFKINGSIKDKGINEKNMDLLKLLIIEWLANHITENDRQFVEFFKENK